MNIEEQGRAVRDEQNRLNEERARRLTPGFIHTDPEAQQPGESLNDWFARKQEKAENHAKRTRLLQNEQNEIMRRVSPHAADEWTREFYRTRWRRHPNEQAPPGDVDAVFRPGESGLMFETEEEREARARAVAAKEAAESERRVQTRAKRAQVLAAIDGKDR